MTRTGLLLATSLIVIVPAHSADPQNPAPNALERKLLGPWQGPACGGDWTYAPDGTFSVVHYSPAGNKLTGTWEVRWNALPPTLVRTCKASDDKDLVGKTWEVRIVQLDDQALAYQYPDQYPKGHTVRYERSHEKAQDDELMALQGTWVPLWYEEGGKKGNAISTRHILKEDRLTVQVNVKTVAEGKVVLDATKNPKRLEYQLASGQTHVIIFVRVGDYVIYCGNRDGKTWPTEFATGTPKGGEYLIAWKIER
jgi:uncharacterized protein (TIGR03067 family)